MAQALAPCPSCSRHVQTSEKTCPFCKSAIVPGATTAIPGTTNRLSRAAAFAFSASLTVAGCAAGVAPAGDGGTEGGSSPDGSTTDSGKKDVTTIPDEGGFAPPYGAPAYGQPPPFDAGGD